MPIYEYHCKDCNKYFEYLVFKSSKIPDCPSCKSTNIDKLISACGLALASKSNGVGGKSIKTSSSCSGCAGSSCATCGS